jgi:hypothetical protein
MDGRELRVKIVGCGGIGGHLAPNLCRFLHAERRAAHLTLIDGDAYEARNRTRMHFTRFGNKASVMAAELAQAFGDVLAVEPLPEYLTTENVAGAIVEHDLVLAAVDNHATRHLIDERIADLADATLISGGNDGIDGEHDGTYGNVQIVRRAGGRSLTSSLGRHHPEILRPADRSPGELGCVDLAQAGGAQLLFTNLAVASAMLNAFYGLLRGTARYEEVYLDIARNRTVAIERLVEEPAVT